MHQHLRAVAAAGLEQGRVVLVDLRDAAVGQDHGVLDDLLRSEPVSLTCSHRVDTQALEEPGRADGLWLAVDEGVVLRRNVLQDGVEVGPGPEASLVLVDQLDVVDVPDLSRNEV